MDGILFIDTETTGKVNFKRPSSDPMQPRVVQIAAILTTDSGYELNKFNFLVRPDHWTIPNEVEEIHGISTKRCQEFGVPFYAIAPILNRFANRATTVVAHSADFDRTMIEIECERLGIPLLTGAASWLCTMKQATPILKLPGKYNDFKWPSLQEAHHHFFKVGIDDAHDAMADVTACMKVYFELRKLMDPPADSAEKVAAGK